MMEFYLLFCAETVQILWKYCSIDKRTKSGSFSFLLLIYRPAFLFNLDEDSLRKNWNSILPIFLISPKVSNQLYSLLCLLQQNLQRPVDDISSEIESSFSFRCLWCLKNCLKTVFLHLGSFKFCEFLLENRIIPRSSNSYSKKNVLKGSVVDLLCTTSHPELHKYFRKPKTCSVSCFI